MGVFGVFGRGEQDQGVFAGSCAQGAGFFGERFQFLEVVLREFFPLIGIVAEPLAQGGAGGEVFTPFVEGGVFFGHAARPEAIRQHAVTFVLWRIVNAFKVYVHFQGLGLSLFYSCHSRAGGNPGG